MYVNYEVKGYADLFQDGPHEPDKVMNQYRDILTYEGVWNCYVVEHREENRRLIGGYDLPRRMT